jgi:hypothetical protein
MSVALGRPTEDGILICCIASSRRSGRVANDRCKQFVTIVCIITHKAENKIHPELVGVTPHVRVVVIGDLYFRHLRHLREFPRNPLSTRTLICLLKLPTYCLVAPLNRLNITVTKKQVELLACSNLLGSNQANKSSHSCAANQASQVHVPCLLDLLGLLG